MVRVGITVGTTVLEGVVTPKFFPTEYIKDKQKESPRTIKITCRLRRK